MLTNLQTRDVETLVHPYTHLAKLRETGPLVIERAKGIHVYDVDGKAYIEGLSGLWCTSLGYGNEEVVEAARAARCASCRSPTCSAARATIRRSSWPRS